MSVKQIDLFIENKNRKTPTSHNFSVYSRLSKTPGSLWNYQWGHALKRSSGTNRKSRVFLSSPT